MKFNLNRFKLTEEEQDLKENIKGVKKEYEKYIWNGEREKKVAEFFAEDKKKETYLEPEGGRNAILKATDYFMRKAIEDFGCEIEDVCYKNSDGFLCYKNVRNYRNRIKNIFREAA